MSANDKRMARGDFWGCWFAVFIVNGLLMYLSTLASWAVYITMPIILILELGLLLATIARLHDTNRSGWNYLWILLPIAGPIILLVFLCQAGTSGPNRFGNPPEK